MARKKASKKKAGAGAGLAAWLSAGLSSPGLRRVGLGIAIAVGVGCLAWGAMFGVGRLEARAGEIVGSEPPELEIHWPSASSVDESWLPESERRRLERIVEQSLAWRWSAFSGQSLGDAGRALLETGWFAEAPTLRVEGRASVVVEGAWRTPSAVVRRVGSTYLVSADARLLPLVYPAGTPLSLRPVIAGVRSAPPARSDGSYVFGESWAREPIGAALELAALIRDEPFEPTIASIDVGQLDDSGVGRLALVTRDGGRVVWGSRPGGFHPGERSDEDKLERLRLIAERYGSIDAGRERLEIYGETVVIDQRALPQRPSTGREASGP